MTTTTFVNGATLSDANWFNDVDAITYDVFNAATTAALARTAISAARTDGANTFASGTQTFSGLGQFNLGLNVAGAAFTSRGITDSATATALTIDSASSVFTFGKSSNTVNLFAASGADNMNIRNTNASKSINIDFSTTGSLSLRSHDGATAYEQVRINHTASATSYITLTGSNGGSPTIGTSGGHLHLTSSGGNVDVTGNFTSTGYVQLLYNTATPAGGAASTGVFMGSANVGIYWGSGAPTISAARGSLYIRTDNGANTSLYVNRDGITTWAAVTSA